MAESKLRILSIDFAVHILNLVKFLKSQHETIVFNQIGRAGTSIGANIHEAQSPPMVSPNLRINDINDHSVFFSTLLEKSRFLF